MTQPDHAPLELNSAHRRHLGASVRYIATLLEESERMLATSRDQPAFRAVRSDLAPGQARVVHAHIETLKAKLVAFADRAELDAKGQPLELRHALYVNATMAAIAVTEMRAPSLRGYGELDRAAAAAIEGLCDELESTLDELRRAIASRAESPQDGPLDSP